MRRGDRNPFVCVTGLVCALFLSAQPSGPAATGHTPISLLFLMDSSGSMVDNDPADIRVAAAEAVVALLEPQDDVAVVQFDSEAKPLTEQRGPWLSAKERDKVFAALRSLGHKGQFTDFRAALGAALGGFSSVTQGHRKVILLLTDGILEPNPLDDAYTPHNLQYRIDIALASRRGRSAISAVNEEYRKRLSPTARRVLAQEIVPGLNEGGIEVFTVGLGAQADREFLRSLAEETSKHPTEVHSFYAEKATDLVPVFARLVEYWTDLTVFHSVGGQIQPGSKQSVYLDEYVSAPRVFTMIDGKGESFVETAAGAAEELEPGMHPGLRSYALHKASPPGSWSFGFGSGEGNYQTSVVGRNGLVLTVAGLKRQYHYGEAIEISAQLRIGGQEGNLLPASKAHALAEIAPVASPSDVLQKAFAVSGNEYRLTYSPPRSGAYTILVTAQVSDQIGRPVLPRRGIRHQIEVLPSFYVLPSRLSFGEASRGVSVTREIEIHSGLPVKAGLTIDGTILESSSSAFRHKQMNRMPAIHPASVFVDPGKAVRQRVVLDLPKNVTWGDYEGRITIHSDANVASTLPFSVHVPSLWEKLRWWVFLVLLLALIFFVYTVYRLGFMSTPSGVLIPVGDCPGVVRTPVKLGDVRRGRITRHLNWYKNRLLVSELRLPNLPAGLDAEFTFNLWGTITFTNVSRPESKLDIGVEEVKEGCTVLTVLRPGRSITFLENKATLQLGACKYHFETI